jgi:hypothetical protein
MKQTIIDREIELAFSDLQYVVDRFRQHWKRGLVALMLYW